MKNNITINQISNENYDNFGIYILIFEESFYIGCAWNNTFYERLKTHIKDALTGTTNKDKQLREEGKCDMDILYILPNPRMSKHRKEKLIKKIENYFIYLGGKFVLEELIHQKIDQEDLSELKSIIMRVMLNYQY